jgi:hypothetical protein
MSDIGKVPATQINWPANPLHNIKKTDKDQRRQRGGEQSEYDERNKRKLPPDNDQQHIDEYV